MTTTTGERTAFAAPTQSSAFSTAYQSDGVAVITVSRPDTTGSWVAGRGSRSTSRPTRAVGAYVVKDGDVRWRPAIDLTRLLTTAELVVGAVIVANRLARRPPGPKAMVTMGPGGWVSMKGGQLGVRRGSRPWARPRRVTATEPAPSAPAWARVLSAVPLQALQR